MALDTIESFREINELKEDIFMKKFLCILLAFLFAVAVMAGCGTSNGTSTTAGSTASAETSGTQAQSASADSTTAPAMDTTPITFTLFDEDGNVYYDNFQSDISQEILKRTGVTLKCEYPVGDAAQKVSLIAASGSYPDFMYITHQRDIFVKQGAFVKLDELVDQYGPNIKKMFGDNITRLHYSLEDKNIYNLGTFGIDGKISVPEAGFMLQWAILKDQGYPKIETVQQFEEAIKTYIAKNPTINGKPAIGLSLLADDWRFMISIRNPAMLATGKPDDGDWYVDPGTGKTVLAMRTPEVKEYFRWLNHMHDIGLLDKESFVQKYEQYIAKIGSGRVLGLIDAGWEVGDGSNALKKAGMEDRTYAMFPVQLNASTKSLVTRDAGFRGDWGVAITKSCKDPVRAIKFLDWMCTEEAQILFNWGIEGKHYKVENGKRVLLPEVLDLKHNDSTAFIKQTGIGLYCARPWPFYGWGVTDSTGQMYSTETREEIKAGYSKTQVDGLKAYGAELELDLYPKTEELPKSKYGVAWQLDFAADSDYKVIMQKYSDLYHKRIPAAVMAKASEFDATWDKFQKELTDIGVEKAEAEFTKMIQTRMELYGGK